MTETRVPYNVPGQVIPVSWLDYQPYVTANAEALVVERAKALRQARLAYQQGPCGQTLHALMDCEGLLDAAVDQLEAKEECYVE